MRNYFVVGLMLTGLIVPLQAQENPVSKMEMKSKRSLVYVSSFSPEKTTAGTSAALVLLNALQSKERGEAEKALAMYKGLIPKEIFGGEYTALEWFLEHYLASPEQQKQMIEKDKLVEHYYRYFADDDYNQLKQYIKRQYTPTPLEEEPEKMAAKSLMLQDLLVADNPKRENWEKSSKIIELLKLKPGDSVADVGAGFGYFSCKFADIVGPQGKVFANDVNQDCLDWLYDYLKSAKIKNVITAKSRVNDALIQQPCDVVFLCSVYHMLYSCTIEQFRRAFVESLKNGMKPDGRLVIVDNSPVEGDEIPYHGSFVAKELIIGQLEQEGLKLVESHQIIPQRYMLVFKLGKAASSLPQVSGKDPAKEIPFTTPRSCVHIGSLDSFDLTEGGIEAAKQVINVFDQKTSQTAEAKATSGQGQTSEGSGESKPKPEEAAHNALAIYKKLVPKENFGGEYSALAWFCEYYLASEEQRKAMRSDKLVDAYFHYLADNDYEVLKEYVLTKYHLRKTQSGGGRAQDPEAGRLRRTFLEDFILFNNPKREEWEQTSKMMALLNIKKGDKVIDIGSGPGYFTYKFSKLVGDEGKVYALDIKKEHIEFVSNFCKTNAIKNIIPVLSTTDDLCVQEQADVLYMCSLYHSIYAVSPDAERDKFIISMKKALKKGGRLLLSDNGPVTDESLPYHGPYINKELIISQLSFYGFKLKEFHQIIPQRYLLVFTLEE